VIDLRLGDCLDILPTLADKSVDAIITDLPYGTTACKWDVIIPFEPMWEQVRRLLKERGTFITTSSQPFTSILIVSNLEMFKYSLIWRKSKPSNFLNAKNKPMPAHEEVNVFSLGTTANLSENKMTYNPQMQIGTPYRKFQKTDPRVGAWDAGNRTPYIGAENINKGERYPTSDLFFPNGNNFSEHPTQKPVALYEYLIRTYTNPAGTVLDFCMGSGTTGVACVNTGRDFIGIEKDAGYYAIAERRIVETSRQQVMPL
jgi:site-specific DNA-methyltransferase (adenine-specific)